MPGDDRYAGKRRSGRTRKGSRAKNTYLGTPYQRLRPPPPTQTCARRHKHSILTAAWHMLTTGELYHDPGADYFTSIPNARSNASSLSSHGSDSTSHWRPPLLDPNRGCPSGLYHVGVAGYFLVRQARGPTWDRRGGAATSPAGTSTSRLSSGSARTVRSSSVARSATSTASTSRRAGGQRGRRTRHVRR
jgi:hypothetical protein